MNLSRPKSYQSPEVCKFCNHSQKTYVGGSINHIYYCKNKITPHEFIKLTYRQQKELIVDEYGSCKKYKSK